MVAVIFREAFNVQPDVTLAASKFHFVVAQTTSNLHCIAQWIMLCAIKPNVGQNTALHRDVMAPDGL